MEVQSLISSFNFESSWGGAKMKTLTTEITFGQLF
jgi:hypothetical protein